MRPGDLETWIGKIAALPDRMRDAVRFLDADQLDTEYRPGGWTIRQVVHHVPDSHLNCYARIKMAITEDEPLIKTYDENGWAGLGMVPEGCNPCRSVEKYPERRCERFLTDAEFARLGQGSRQWRKGAHRQRWSRHARVNNNSHFYSLVLTFTHFRGIP